MSWVKNNTYNLIDRFQVRTRQEIFKFHQFDSGLNSYGESIWIQSERDELNYHLLTQFNEMREWLGFYPRPIWKKIKVPLNQQLNYDEQIYRIPESAWLNDLGVRATELIEAGATYTKNPISGQATHAVFEITTDEVTNGEVCFFHTASDSFNNIADDRFRVLPDSIYYNGASYIVSVPYARLIKPILWEKEFVTFDPQDRQSYSISDDSNYVGSLDVYRIYNDSTVSGRLIGAPYSYSNSSALQSENVAITVLDSEDATFKIQSDSSLSFNPTHVEVYAYIGYPLTEQKLMYPIIEEFVIRKSRVEMGINAKLAEVKISTLWQYDYLPSYTKMDNNNAFGGVGYRPNPIGARNVDVEMFAKLLPISNSRGKINDMRFWTR